MEDLFNKKSVRQELRAYRKRGPAATTRLLTEALVKEGVQDASLLDIGGGLGAIQHALLQAGAKRVVDVDASLAYITAAREETARRGLGERIRYLHGDFTALAELAGPADIVTLDRVICCYDDMPRLVESSAGLAQRLYGLVYPLDAWWVRLGMKALNAFMTLQGSQYRSYIHPTRAVEALVSGLGFRRHYYARQGYWQVVVYSRA